MIVAVLQARMSSTRLPGKVLADVIGQPMILRQLERLQPAAVDRIVVATTGDTSDDPLADAVSAAGYEVFRGSADNVLDRVWRAARNHPATHIVRLTADCPLADCRVIDQVIADHIRSNSDYTSNTLVRTFPDGIDVEVVRTPVLEQAWRNAAEPDELEHVTPYIYRRPETFSVLNVANTTDQARYRLTVDYEEDLEVIRRIFATLYPEDDCFALADVIALLEREPRLIRMNAAYNPMLTADSVLEAQT